MYNLETSASALLTFLNDSPESGNSSKAPGAQVYHNFLKFTTRVVRSTLHSDDYEPLRFAITTMKGNTGLTAGLGLKKKDKQRVTDVLTMWLENFSLTLPEPTVHEAEPMSTESAVADDSENSDSDDDDGPIPQQSSPLKAELFECLAAARNASESEHQSKITSVAEQFWKEWMAFLWIHAKQENKQPAKLDDWAESSFEFDAWQNAWEVQFRGDSLSLLQRKLQVHMQMLRQLENSNKGNTSVSRVIPIVQGSGAGKSRLAEE